MNPVIVRLMAARRYWYICPECRDTGTVVRYYKVEGGWGKVVKVPCPYCTKPADAKPA